METIKHNNVKNITISCNNAKIKLYQFLELNNFDLDTFYKRLKWLLTGKVSTFMNHKGKIKKITKK